MCIIRLVLVFSAFACHSGKGESDTGGVDGDTDTDTDSDTDSDSDSDADSDTDTDSDSDTDADSDADSDADMVDYAVTAVSVAAAGDGFDLDGDGTVDNSLASISFLLDPVLEQALSQSSRSLVVQLADVDDWTDDSLILLGIFTATDNGDGTWDAGASVDSDGLATFNVDARLSGGIYDAEYNTDVIEVAGYSFETATPIYLEGEPTPTAQTGILALGVPTQTLIDLATDAGYGDYASYLSLLADLDTDGDGNPDAVSMALDFDGSAITVVP